MADIIDDQPIALRRKRRSQSIASDTRATRSLPSVDNDSETAELATPRKPKKRVRFSDPGPDLYAGSSTTGITPFVKRTTLSDNRQDAIRSPSRTHHRSARQMPAPRRSLPAASSAPWLSPPSSDNSDVPIDFNFTPLRETLNNRTIRRLKRRHMSAEMNEIDSDRKLAIKQEQRIVELERKLETVNATHSTVKSMPSTSSRDKVEELQAEIGSLREQLRTQPPTPEPMTPADDFDEMLELNSQARSSPCPTVAFSDDFDAGFSTPSPLESGPHTPTCTAIAVQTDPLDDDILILQEHSKRQKDHLMHARLELERLLPGETALPLSPSSEGDASPLLSAMLSHLQSAMTEVNRAKSLLAASEAQEKKLRSEFNKSLKHAESARSYTKLLEGNLGKVNKIFHDQKAKTTAEMRKAAEQIQRLQEEKQQLGQEKRDFEHSISSLTSALDRYRADVKDLEALITSMESKHADMIAKLDEKHKQQISDVEAHVDAEIRGRRSAEAEVEGLHLRVAEIESVNRELKSAVNQKQKTLREMEASWDEQREDLERQVGGANTRLCQAQGQIAELEEQVAVEKRRTFDAVEKVVESARKTGEETVRQVLANSDGSVSFGLLTPHVEGGRFIDVISSHVDGRVENRRGKASKKRKHPDSGIGLIEEDESELLSSDI